MILSHLYQYYIPFLTHALSAVMAVFKGILHSEFIIFVSVTHPVYSRLERILYLGVQKQQ